MEQGYAPPEVPERRGQSRMGVASFVIAVLATVVMVGGIVAVGAVGGQAVGGGDPQQLTPQDLQRNLEESPGAVGVLAAAGLGFVAGPFLFLIGLGLGIAGLFQRRRTRLFAGLGTAFNGLALLAIVGLFVLGAALAPMAG